jgi:hypothetical protein
MLSKKRLNDACTPFYIQLSTPLSQVKDVTFLYLFETESAILQLYSRQADPKNSKVLSRK